MERSNEDGGMVSLYMRAMYETWEYKSWEIVRYEVRGRACFLKCVVSGAIGYVYALKRRLVGFPY